MKNSGAKEGLKFPMGSAHWENKVEHTICADGKYASEMNAASELKDQVDGLANYAKSHRAKH